MELKSFTSKIPSLLYDVVIVGSGPAGVHAAYPLVEAGLTVAIVDGGLDSRKQIADSQEKSFQTKSNALDILMKGSYAFSKTYQLLKIHSNIDPIQTLAKGGLSEFWHGMCDFLTKEEITELGLPADEIIIEYPFISKRIHLAFKPDLDTHGKLLFRHVSQNLYRLSSAHSYRTSKVIKNFTKYKNFTYLSGLLALKAKEENNHVDTTALKIENMEPIHIKSHYLILAAGAINTTRILLRSFNLFNHKTSFLTKSHYMIVCFHPKTLFLQSNIMEDVPGQIAFSSNKTAQRLSACVQLYRFNPLMVDKALEYIPLPKFLSSFLLSTFKHTLVIADVRFPSFESKNKYCRLKKRQGKEEVFEIVFKETNEELEVQKRELKAIHIKLWSLGLIPLKSINDIATSHYGAGVTGDRLSADKNGKVNKTKRIYVADSATWKALAAKPLALTIMANASRVAKHVLENFNN